MLRFVHFRRRLKGQGWSARAASVYTPQKNPKNWGFSGKVTFFGNILKFCSESFHGDTDSRFLSPHADRHSGDISVTVCHSFIHSAGFLVTDISGVGWRIGDEILQDGRSRRLPGHTEIVNREVGEMMRNFSDKKLFSGAILHRFGGYIVIEAPKVCVGSCHLYTIILRTVILWSYTITFRE